MTIRFTPARARDVRFSTKVGAGVLTALHMPANDNLPLGTIVANDEPLLAETLRHFAEHGLRAAQRAGEMAVAAHRSGDALEFDWWLSVCRMLDRRLADRVERETATAG